MLIHPLFIFLFAVVFEITGHTGAMAFYLVACTAATFALNRLVERPAIAFVKRRSGKGAAASPP